MRDLVILFVHVIATLARLLGPGGFLTLHALRNNFDALVLPPHEGLRDIFAFLLQSKVQPKNYIYNLLQMRIFVVFCDKKKL